VQKVATLNPPASGAVKKRAAIFLAAAFFFFLWFVLCRDLSGEWSVNEQYSYGWFVPFFALYLFWLRWEGRPGERRKEKVGSRKFLLSILLASGALLLLLPVRLFEIGNPDWRPLGWIHAGAVATVTLIYIWYAGGKPWLRHFAFPIAFFFVAVPWVSVVEEPIIQGLMRAVAAVATETVALFGIPAQLQGNLIRVSGGLVGVNEACSGVRSFQTSLMIGLLFGELRRLSILRRVALVVGAAAIAIIANFLRAIVLVWIASRQGVAAIDRWHDVAGYSIVAIVFGGSLALAGLLNRNKVESRKAKVESAEAGGGQSFLLPNFYFVLFALVWILLVEFSAHAWYRVHEQTLIPRPMWTVAWDRLPSGFHTVKIPEGARQTLRFDDGKEVSWQTSDHSSRALTSTEYLFFFRWNPGGASVVRARAHRPDICLPSVGWKQIADSGAKNYTTRDGILLPVRHIAFAQEGRRGIAHTFFCLQEDKVHAEEARPDLELAQGVQPDWSIRGRTEAVKNGVRNLGQQVLEVVIVSAQPLDDAAAEEKFAEIAQEIIKGESKK
jgi:exosortase